MAAPRPQEARVLVRRVASQMEHSRADRAPHVVAQEGVHWRSRGHRCHRARGPGGARSFRPARRDQEREGWEDSHLQRRDHAREPPRAGGKGASLRSQVPMGGHSPSRRARAFRTREHVRHSWRRADGVQKEWPQADGGRRRTSDLGLPQHRTAQLATGSRHRPRDPGARCGTRGQRGRHRCCLRGSVGHARPTRRTPAAGGAQGAVLLLGHGAALLHALAARAGLQ
mmetsp:Transcript_83510/g.202552  ORF Transcript_83510/g.202552 Transcript_83510/m.202552 type:complete len:227 (-) Transcript_83510:198-878(-)